MPDYMKGHQTIDQRGWGAPYDDHDIAFENCISPTQSLNKSSTIFTQVTSLKADRDASPSRYIVQGARLRCCPLIACRKARHATAAVEVRQRILWTTPRVPKFEGFKPPHVFHAMLLKRPSSLHLICLSLIPFLALTSTATIPLRHPTNAIQPIESNDLTTNQPANLTADPQYTIYPVFEGPSLDQTALLMSAVQLMAREAAEDINDDIRPTTWMSRDARFSNIAIQVLPPSNANTIPRRLTLWALSESLQLLIQRNRFAGVKFRITRDGINAGSIEIGHPFSQQQQYIPPPPPTTNQTPNAANATPAAARLQVFNIRVYIRRSRFGYDLPPSAVFGPVIAILHHIASAPPRSRVRSYKTPAKIGGTALAFGDTGHRPFFYKEQLIEAAATVPLFMINKGVFSEVDVEMRLPSEVLLAKGSLRIERTPRPHLGVRRDGILGVEWVPEVGFELL